MEQTTLEFVRDLRRNLDANKEIIEAAWRAREPVEQHRELMSTVRWAQDLMARNQKLVDQASWARRALAHAPQDPTHEATSRWASDLLRDIGRSDSAGRAPEWAREAMTRLESVADPRVLVSDAELFHEGTFSDGIEETDWAGLGEKELGGVLAEELTGDDQRRIMERIVSAPPHAQVALIAALLGMVLLIWSAAESVTGGEVPNEAQAAVAGLATTLAAVAAVLACTQNRKKDSRG